jgi:ubiquinol-cytochrome c reductase cytochrome c subunit
MVRGLRLAFIPLALLAYLVPVVGTPVALGDAGARAPAIPMHFAARAAASNASEGARIFADNCAACHGPDGKGTGQAPSLEAVSEAGVAAQTVRSGKDGMPSFAGQLSDTEISAVAQYVATDIATVSLAGGDVSRGNSLYGLNCAGCHGSTARGGALVDAGENAPDLDELRPSEIATAIRSGPGPMPVFPPSVLNQYDLSSIVMYVETLQQPEDPGGLALWHRGPMTEGLAAAAVIGLLALAAVWIEKRGRG